MSPDSFVKRLRSVPQIKLVPGSRKQYVKAESHQAPMREMPNENTRI
jgi:hypothetical protein